MDDGFDYIIQEVFDSSTGSSSEKHERIIGKRCLVDTLEVGQQCYMIVEPYGNHLSSRWYATSRVHGVCRNIKTGELVINTENSVYILNPINGGDSSDLFRQCSDHAD